MSIGAKGIQHIGVSVPDLDKARAFYAGLVGALGGSELMRMEENGFTLFGIEFKPVFGLDLGKQRGV